MKFLLRNRFAPTTLAFGFLRESFETVKLNMLAWRTELKGRFPGKWDFLVEGLDGPLEAMLWSLEPLNASGSHELIIETRTGWVAYFSNALLGSDPDPTMQYLSSRIGCQGVTFTCIPDRPIARKMRARESYGSITLQVFDSDSKRSIGIANDGGRWIFDNVGQPCSFEETHYYKKPNLRDRFTAELLEQYLEALDIRAFDEGFYGPKGLLIIRDISSFPAEAKRPYTYSGLQTQMRWDLDSGNNRP